MPGQTRTHPGKPRDPAAIPGWVPKTVLAACALLAVTACGVLMPPASRQQQNQAAPGARPARTATAPRANPDIYRLLPFTRQQITAAATLAARFTRLYGTYSYDQPPAAYLARLAPLTTSTLQQALAQGFTAPGLISQRSADRESVTTTVAVTAIRDIGGTSITFLVTASQQATTAGVTRQSAQVYAVTVTLNAGTWKVYDIELANAGQAGSLP